MALIPHNAEMEALRPIELDGAIYVPATTVRATREHRSKVSKFNDEGLRRLPYFKYDKLASMRRRIRLLRLFGGGLNNPEITCELFEVEYDKKNIVRKIENASAAKKECRRSRDSAARDHANAENYGAPDEPAYNHDQSKGDDVSYDDLVEYEALSWCWGTENRDCGIRINKGREQFRLPVTKELILALKYLRHSHQDRILWIDALCINQEDHEERNHQVQMMSRIYNCAKQVCVWLGEDNDDSTTAISFVHEIMKLENFDSISEKKENASKWQSLLLLMQRPWFSRRWVVQEIALARAATIYCGSDEIAWEHFAVAVELFVEVETATHRLSEVMQKNEAFGHVPQWFEHVSELGASVLVQATGKVFRQDGTHTATKDEKSPQQRAAKFQSLHKLKSPKKSAGGKRSSSSYQPPEYIPQRPLLSLEYLVSSLSVFEATQPRDAVYSLLAISRDTSPFAELSTMSKEGSEEVTILSTVSSFLERKPFKVDYSRPYSDVCKDFVHFCIKGATGSDPTRALDILCRPWAPDPVSHVAGTITHKKPILYKFLRRKRQKLFEPNKNKPRLRRDPDDEHPDKSKRKLIPDDREGFNSYFQQCEPSRAQWLHTMERFLPKKPEQPKREQDDTSQTDEEDSELSESEDEPEEEHDLDLPSWVSRISGASFALFHHPGMHSMERMGRKNADPLVGLPQDGHRNYSAAQNTKVDHESERRLRFCKRPTLRHYSLYINGFILDEIQTVAEPARLGAIPETWPEIGGWKDAVDGTTDPPQEFWRTLVADRGKDNRNPPYYYATACKESVKKGGLRGGSVDTGALINSERNSIIAEFCRRVQAVIWNRCLIKTKKGTLGLTSQHVKPGDYVCILFGCTVPVILRRAQRKTQEQHDDEKIEDRLQAMKATMTLCEDACFRKLRYKNTLKSVKDPDSWKDEVLAEMQVINDQMREWKQKKQAAEKEKREEDKRKRERKLDGEKRRKERQVAKEARQTQLESPSITHRVPPRASTVVGVTQPQTRKPLEYGASGSKHETQSNSSFEEEFKDPENELNPNGEAPKVKSREGNGDIGSIQNAAVGASHHFSDQSQRNGEKGEKSEKEREEAKKKAKSEDPYFHYAFKGEAYIHGMMDGEAVRQYIVEVLPERLFEIR